MSQFEKRKGELDTSSIIQLSPASSDVSNYAPYENSYCYKISDKVHLHVGMKIDITGWVKILELPVRL